MREWYAFILGIINMYKIQCHRYVELCCVFSSLLGGHPRGERIRDVWCMVCCVYVVSGGGCVFWSVLKIERFFRVPPLFEGYGPSISTGYDHN